MDCKMGGMDEPMKPGYRILSVDSGSPASELPIEPMLDFIIFPEEDPDLYFPSGRFNNYIFRRENQETELTFFNVASQTKWKGKVTPRKWRGSGLLGVDYRMEDYTLAHVHVVRVLHMYFNSPMHKAGLRAGSDYILASRENAFVKPEDFLTLVAEYNQQPCDLAVYNSEDRVVRQVVLTPDSGWGGKGALGGEIGFGHLHSLPIRREKPKPRASSNSYSNPNPSPSPSPSPSPDPKIAEEPGESGNSEETQPPVQVHVAQIEVAVETEQTASVGDKELRQKETKEEPATTQNDKDLECEYVQQQREGREKSKDDKKTTDSGTSGDSFTRIHEHGTAVESCENKEETSTAKSNMCPTVKLPLLFTDDVLI